MLSFSVYTFTPHLRARDLGVRLTFSIQPPGLVFAESFNPITVTYMRKDDTLSSSTIIFVFSTLYTFQYLQLNY